MDGEETGADFENIDFENALALEIGKVFLSAHRTAADVIHGAQRKSGREYRPPNAVPASGLQTAVRDDDELDALAAHVDRIEQVLVDGRLKMLRIVEDVVIPELTDLTAFEQPQPNGDSEGSGNATTENLEVATERAPTETPVGAHPVEPTVPWAWAASRIQQNETEPRRPPVGEKPSTVTDQQVEIPLPVTEGSSPEVQEVETSAPPVTEVSSVASEDEAGATLPTVGSRETKNSAFEVLASFPPPVPHQIVQIEYDAGVAPSGRDMASVAESSTPNSSDTAASPSIPQTSTAPQLAPDDAQVAPTSRAWLVNAVAAAIVIVVLTIALLLVNTI